MKDQILFLEKLLISTGREKIDQMVGIFEDKRINTYVSTDI